MVDADVAGLAAQFGAAGLMGWMWLSERRAAAAREQQLGEAHERLMGERTAVDVLTRCIEGNTRALTALEVGQRQWSEVMRRLLREHEGEPKDEPGDTRGQGPGGAAGPAETRA